MDASQPSRRAAENFSKSGTTRTDRQQLPPGSAVSPFRLGPPADPGAIRLAAAEQNLADAYHRVRVAGADRDSVDTAFALLWDCIAEVKACREQAQLELALAHYEWHRASRQHPNPAQDHETAVSSAIPGQPALNLCPDPGRVRTPAEFMDCLRRFRIWSGKVSYRAMERKCGHRFAASTFCTVLKGNELPSFDMVQVIVTVCDGSEQQQDLFGHAWRRLKLQQDADQPAKQPVKKPVKKPQSRPLRAVSETA